MSMPGPWSAKQGYYLAASLFLLCGNFVNFVLAIGLGSLAIFFLMNLVGYRSAWPRRRR